MENLVTSADDLHRAFAGKRILLTGHTGFKGAWLSIWLSRLGAKLTGLSLNPPTTPCLFDEAEVAKCLDDRRVDVRDADAVAKTFAEVQPEAVFHLAAQAIVRESYEIPLETLATNIMGTAHILDAARMFDSVRVIVNVTSDKCYENRGWEFAYREDDAMGGHDPYSASKGAAELVAASYRQSFLTEKKIGLASVRAGNVIGGGDWAKDRIVPDSIRALAAGVPIPVRNPHATRPWQHVLEPLAGYLMVAARLFDAPEQFASGWNFGPATLSQRPVGDLATAMVEAWGSGSWDDLSAKQANAPHEAKFLALAWDKAYRHLGCQPRWEFAETIQRTCQWYQRHCGGESALSLCEEDIVAYQNAMGTPSKKAPL